MAHRPSLLSWFEETLPSGLCQENEKGCVPEGQGPASRAAWAGWEGPQVMGAVGSVTGQESVSLWPEKGSCVSRTKPTGPHGLELQAGASSAQAGQGHKGRGPCREYVAAAVPLPPLSQCGRNGHLLL